MASCSTLPPITWTCFAGSSVTRWKRSGRIARFAGYRAGHRPGALTMRSGVEVQSFFSFRSGLADYLEFIGERGTLRVDRHSPVLTLGCAALWIRRPACVGRTDGGSVISWRLCRAVRPSYDPSYRRSL